MHITPAPFTAPYDGFAWTLRAHLPADYPLRSPSIGFATPIWHPNVCPSSGSICLDVLNSAWTPTYTLEVIVTLLLPQLLSHPNPSDPLNSEAAALARTDPADFASFVRAHCMKHARPVAAVGCGGGGAGGGGDGSAGGVAAMPPPVTATVAGVAALASPDWVAIERAARGEEAGSPLSSL